MSAEMDGPTDPVAGGVGVDAGEPVWDWGNLLDLAQDDDDSLSLVLPWDDHAAGVETTDPTTATQPAASLLATPPRPRAQGTGPGRVRKRDPRLVCPNYLAGRVLCSCPEEDQMAAAAEAGDVATELLAGARKKAKTKTKTSRRRGEAGADTGGGAPEMRCQVPGCEVDIRDLKGYHRRHRVCLRCAHAAAVTIDGVQRRYCQQCGRFHLLPDFDGDKRSCRRKLERHNKRRRRKTGSKGSIEKEMDEHLDLSADASGDGDVREENIECTSNEMLETVLSNKVLNKETPLVSEDFLSSPTCPEPSLQNEQSKSAATFLASVEACNGAKQESVKHANSPMHDTKSAYSSSCPTGRIAFKLYDWNPAEFPRRLRHQIFEWLSSMPVELEGYIRPGCTILTVFIAMPQHMWDKFSDDTANLLRKLVNYPNSLLLGKGAFFIHFDNTIFQVSKDVATLKSIKLKVQAPRIHYVHPTWFEAGKPAELLLCGSSLDQPKFRSLLSFDGDYLKHDCFRLSALDEFSSVEKGDLTPDSQHEMFRISISQLRPDTYGPAFVEVENVSGLSNFVPILFGSKQLCSELEKIQDILCSSSMNNDIFGEFPDASSNPCEHQKFRKTAMARFLVDIGWLIKKPTPDELKHVLSLTNIQRWVCMLKFLIQNEFFNILEIIVKSMDSIIGSEILSHMERGRLEDHITTFLGYVNHARSIVDHRSKHGKETELQARWPIDNPKQPSVGTYVPLHNGYTGLGSDNDLHLTSGACKEEVTVPLMTKVSSHRQCCRPGIGARWFKPSLIITLPGRATRVRFLTTLVVAAILCFTVCVVLLHPHKLGVVLSAPVKSYLFRVSA